MENLIYADKNILKKIDEIDSRKLSEFYKLLYNMLINHFITYRIISTGFFSESVREVATFDNIAREVCKAQSIFKIIPILGDLVGIPFQIIKFMREEKSSYLDSIIADKINGSRLQLEARITCYMSNLLEILIDNEEFNSKLMKALQKEEDLFLNKAMNVFGQLKEKIYAKFIGGFGGYSYVQQAVVAYMARLKLHLYDVNSYQFQQHCKSEETFSDFFMEAFSIPKK